MRFPNIPKKYEKDFIRGYIDGDGSISQVRNKPYFVISITSNKIFLTNLAKKLIQRRIEVSHFENKKNFSTIHFNYTNSVKLCEFIYSEPCTLYLHRKKKVYDKFIKKWEEFKVCPICNKKFKNRVKTATRRIYCEECSKDQMKKRRFLRNKE